MKNKRLILLFFITSSLCYSQQLITWKNLAEVKYIEKFFPDYDDYFLYPNFSASLKKLDDQKITITGYFLSIDPENKLHVLSKGPMSSCFFCGEGGPETAIELQFVNKPNFKTDDIVSITGVLKLNKDDVEHFNYILQECKGELVE